MIFSNNIQVTTTQHFFDEKRRFLAFTAQESGNFSKKLSAKVEKVSLIVKKVTIYNILRKFTGAKIQKNAKTNYKTAKSECIKI